MEKMNQMRAFIRTNMKMTDAIMLMIKTVQSRDFLPIEKYF